MILFYVVARRREIPVEPISLSPCPLSLADPADSPFAQPQPDDTGRKRCRRCEKTPSITGVRESFLLSAPLSPLSSLSLRLFPIPHCFSVITPFGTLYCPSSDCHSSPANGIALGHTTSEHCGVSSRVLRSRREGQHK